MNIRTSFQINASVLFALVLREMKGRFGRVRMGPFWTLAEPLLHLMAFTTLVTFLHGHGADSIDYPVFLLSGLAPFILYRNVALSMMESLDANKALFSYKQIKPLDTFVSRTIVESIISALVYVLISLGFLWYGYGVSIARPLEWLGVLLLGLFFGFALGLCLAILVSALPELKFIIRLGFLPLYIISGVMFSPSRFPVEILNLLLWNPFLHIIELVRAAMFEFYEPVSGVSMFYVCSVTLVLMFFALGLYRLRRLDLVALQ